MTRYVTYVIQQVIYNVLCNICVTTGYIKFYTTNLQILFSTYFAAYFIQNQNQHDITCIQRFLLCYNIYVLYNSETSQGMAYSTS